MKLLIALVIFILMLPFAQDSKDGAIIEIVLLTMVLVASLLAVSGERRTLVLSAVLLVPALAGKWLHHFRPDLLPSWLFLGASLLFFGFVVINLLQFVLRAARVDSEVLCAGISIYLLLGLLWANAYVLVAHLTPEAFAFTVAGDPHKTMDRFNAFYFSFTTLSTVGFGDITPVSREARTLAVTEAVVGMFYVTILIARLVSVYSVAPPTKSAGN